MAVILVADDDRHIRELVRLMMEQSGFDVAEAEDGEAAVRLIESAPIDLIILDVMMPK
ncbi:response regulator, partial [Bacillus velezensis]